MNIYKYLYINLLTSLDGGYCHQGCWGWVGDGTHPLFPVQWCQHHFEPMCNIPLPPPSPPPPLPEPECGEVHGDVAQVLALGQEEEVIFHGHQGHAVQQAVGHAKAQHERGAQLRPHQHACTCSERAGGRAQHAYAMHVVSEHISPCILHLQRAGQGYS